MRRLLCLFFGIFVAAALLRAEDLPSSPGALLLKNGEVLVGAVTRLADRYQVAVPGGEVRVRKTDVELTGRDSVDLYEQQRVRLAPDAVDTRLELADWCLRQNLLAAAAAELDAAARQQPSHRRISVLRDRLSTAYDKARPPALPTVSAASKPSPELSPHADLERLIRELPRGSVETYTRQIQPILFNSCAAAGCHGPRPESKYSLQRPNLQQLADHRITQRNLQATLAHVDFERPADSRLLRIVTQPHGGAKTALVGSPPSPQYQQLADWVSEVTQPVTAAGGKPNTAPTVALWKTMNAMGFAVPGEQVDPIVQPQFGAHVRKPRHSPSEATNNRQ